MLIPHHLTLCTDALARTAVFERSTQADSILAFPSHDCLKLIIFFPLFSWNNIIQSGERLP